MRRERHRAHVAFLWAATCLAPACGVLALEGGARSPRNANYTIEVTLDPAAKTLTGSQLATWRNITDQPASELRFHLYWNAWRNNRSTWMREDRLRGRSDRGDEPRPEDWSYQTVSSVRMPASGDDLTATLQYLWPDDGNIEDRTLFRVTLPREVGPGDSVTVEIEWEAKIPRTFARTGFRGDFFFLAHWFPKLGVFENGAWTANQYHAATEYYADYGVYDVAMTVPAGWMLGATGREIERRDNGDGTATHRYLQEDVHAFSWTTSPDYREHRERFEAPGLQPVELRFLYQPEHEKQVARHVAATRAALELYGTWYGPYPYEQLTFVDPAYGSGAGGMEYPTLFTCGTRLFNPEGGGSPEGVTIHEAGHQFWYGVVGNNEFEFAWLDEGLNTFSTARVREVAHADWFLTRRYFTPPGTDEGRGFFPLLFRDIRLRREIDGNRIDRYRRTARSDIPATPTWQYHPGTASGISYSKTAIWLHTLERYLGWDALRAVLSTFYRRFSFRHPRAEDFFAVANEIAGQDLTWFFRQVIDEARTFDYAVDSVSSEKLSRRGYFERGGELTFVSDEEEFDASGSVLYRTEVVVRRLGSGVFPVEILLVFDDDSEIRRPWDGRGRWTLVAHEGTARLRYAAVDPERVLLLDENYTNNSRCLDNGGRWPAVKWAGKWMVWFQETLWAFASFA